MSENQEVTKFVIRNGTLIDGTGQKPVHDSTVLIEGNQVVDLNESKGKTPSGAKEIDAKGKVVMPGMMDLHLHLVSIADPTEPHIMASMLSTSSQLLALYAARHAKDMLEAGFTSIRDLGGYGTHKNALEVLSVRKAIEIGLHPGPRVFVAGWLSATAGHLDMGLPPVQPRDPTAVADGPWEVRKRVREMIREGVDLIKTSSSGGGGGYGEELWWRNYTVEELVAMVEEAHSMGRRVAAHAHWINGIKNAVEARVDTVEHGTYLDEETAKEMKSKDLILVPTLAVGSDRAVKSRAAGGSPASVMKKVMAISTQRGQQVRIAKKVGVKIACGTDTYRALRYFWGQNAYELELMCTLGGLTEMESIVAATGNAGEALGLKDKLGTVQPGRLADILLIDGDPLQDIKILQDHKRILMVMKDGKICVDRGIHFLN